MVHKVCTAYVDGAAKGNPGPAGLGVVLLDGDGNTLREIAEPLGCTTNNVAEYHALIRALEEARALGCERIRIFTDSELMARQIEGTYRVKTAHLWPLYQQARLLMGQFKEAMLTSVPREQNKRADMLSKIGVSQAATQSSCNEQAV
ncbi:MAG TPA: ribonuclease HI family protein [Chthonomonas sp.]|uniref:ribonuclease HI family protein n=1 Tax=Chthonomonas sp. TaxID=2282153 RepID=UPI002B4B5C56|nr:ribonuclease HI family protein [Chthonomonas sp.]HLI47765.1 ribonuclease HI family protein [Chthonomonas sp.]